MLKVTVLPEAALAIPVPPASVSVSSSKSTSILPESDVISKSCASIKLSVYALILCCVASFVALLDAILSSSKTALPETCVLRTLVLIVGLVKVLFVNVSESANVPKLSPCKAALNSAKEPVRVLESRSKVLFVNVSVVALPISVSVASGILIVLSPVGSTNAQVVSWLSALAPSKTRGLAADKTVPVTSNVPVNEPLKVPPLIVGLVNVLFVNVSALSIVAKVALCKAALNSAKEPVRVLASKSTDLFVSVSVLLYQLMYQLH